ncbi:hypothetical protein BpHYR1_004995 [Brachionus plicatilis]|uniref:Uncharacterized protein n=1 Tax=Brachionus plicatilis TaxID=10195 RepID=A0A3M7S2U3_BRAPC|nr:hypothetical protein BpHYR1_004995 [Brachionus plicatilis]
MIEHSLYLEMPWLLDIGFNPLMMQAQYLLLIIFAPHLSHNFSSACMFETILSLLDTFSSIGLLASSSSESMPFGAKFDD